jgi:two-component system, NtrC family, response regulator HydG
MNPKIAITAGPSNGMVFELTADEVTVGREPSNLIPIADLALSRRHCLIKKEGAAYTVVDLDSYNGSFVNGMPVKEHTLKHGDSIKIGDSILVFLADQSEAPPISSAVRLENESPISRSTVRLQMKDALYLQSEKVLAALPRSERVARDLNALLRISAVLNSLRNSDELQRQLLESLLEVTPAERGAILLVSSDDGEFDSVFGWNRATGPAGEVRVSRTIVSQVLAEGQAILSGDIVEGSGPDAAQSLMASHTSSLLCVPMIIFGRTLGAIYLDTSDSATYFDEDHLQLVTAIASIAAAPLDNARHMEWLESENRRLQEDSRIEHNMIGESARMREVYQIIAKAAPTDSTVLIGGESGTGKELAAQAIHLNSARAAGPFVAINCAALTETLLESELFGHERGAFTGAVAQKRGKLEMAEGGTIFLDEIGELAPPMQAKLLRVLQQREFERVGGTRPIKLDIRLIAATNRDLEEATRSGSFRQDLYYRLNVVRLTMPPLRERREDIALLANYFAAKYSKKCKRRVAGISAQARARLSAYSWPGNVRELENAVERAIVLGSSDVILAEELPEDVLESQPAAAAPLTSYHDAVNNLKRQLIVKAVEQAAGNYTEAARLLGVHPNYLHRLIRNMNLKEELKK